MKEVTQQMWINGLFPTPKHSNKKKKEKIRRELIITAPPVPSQRGKHFR